MKTVLLALCLAAACASNAFAQPANSTLRVTVVDPAAGRYRLSWESVNDLYSGVAILLNSHLLSEVELVCDTVAILAKGRVLKEGTMAEVVPEGRNLEDVFVELIQANTPQHDQLPSFITEQEKK